MSEKEKKINDEEKTIPRPEGYTIVKYAFGWVLFISMLFSLVISAVFIVAFNDYFSETDAWLVWIMLLVIYALFFVIGCKITEVKVNLKITDEGLEQTRLSGSRIYPKYRLIKWEDMKHYHLYGKGRGRIDFLVSVKDDMNFRISIPLLPLFEKQKDNCENFIAFRDDFWGILKSKRTIVRILLLFVTIFGESPPNMMCIGRFLDSVEKISIFAPK